MRGLYVAVGVLSVLLVVGGIAVVGTEIARSGGKHAPVGGAGVGMGQVVLDEPAGTRIVGAGGVGGDLAVLLQGGGPDRVVVVDAATGRVAGGVRLGR
jgi:hypothetical protein